MGKMNGGIAALLIGAAFFGWVATAGGAPPSPSPVVSYPVKNFEDGKARFYEYKADGNLTIKYFVIKSSDGVIRAAFDACDVCWPEGKGYRQQGDFMVCNNCGRRFASVKVNVITGGCNPGALTRTLEGGQLVIKTDDILKGRR